MKFLAILIQVNAGQNYDYRWLKCHIVQDSNQQVKIAFSFTISAAQWK